MLETRSRKYKIIGYALLILLVLIILGWFHFAFFGQQNINDVHGIQGSIFLDLVISERQNLTISEYTDKVLGFFILTHVLLFSITILGIGFLKTRNYFDSKKYAAGVISIYLALTAIAIDYTISIVYFRGFEGLYQFLREGPISNLDVTVFTVISCWLLLGSLLVLLARKIINKKNLLLIFGFYFIAFLYLNFLRERPQYGDSGDYIRAAFNLFNGEHLDPRYLYPPFFATCLKPLVPLGAASMEIALMIANYISLLLFYILLNLGLQRYGYTRNLAALASIIMLGVNVPVLRNMGYMQVNIHVANLVLMCILFWPRFTPLSALALSLAVHLKSSPIIMVLAFIFSRQWKWLLYFISFFIGIFFITVFMNGIGCYYDFLYNVAHIFPNQGSAFRDNSIDSFLHSTYWVLGIPRAEASVPIAIMKLILIAVSLIAINGTVRKRVYFNNGHNESVVHNSYVILIFLMMMLSPLVWAYHPVFIIFPFLVMLSKVSKPLEIILFSTAYAFIFLMPTFDFYPLSYNNIVAVILCYFLFFSFLGAGDRDAEWFTKLNRKSQFDFGTGDSVDSNPTNSTTPPETKNNLG